MQNFHENLSSISVTRSGPALAATFIDDDKTLHNVPNSSGLPHYNNMHTRACAHALTHRTAPHHTTLHHTTPHCTTPHCVVHYVVVVQWGVLWYSAVWCVV